MGTNLIGRYDSVSLKHRIKLVRRKIAHRFNGTRGPADFHFVNFGGRAQPEMNTQVVLRKVASAVVNFFCLGYAACDDLETGIQSQTIALRSCKFEAHPMAPRNTSVLQHHWTAVQIADHDINISVVE